MNTNSTIVLLATAIALSLAGANAQQWTTNTLPPGLIAWWAAEGNLLDSAGAHHGSGSAAPTYAPGRFGQAFHFNGSDQSVAVGDIHPDLDSWTQFTLEAWVFLDNRIDGTGGGQAIISKVGDGRQPGPDLGYQFGFGQGATKLFCQFNTIGQPWPGFQTVADLGGPAPTNTWLHVVASYDHNAVKIYFNGVALTTNVIGPTTIVNCDASLRLNSDDNDNVAFAGRIDDARIYNRALTAAEMARLALGLPGANGVWGLKTHDPLSQAPTTLFRFSENPAGTGAAEIGRVKLAGVEIDADALAMSPAGAVYAFQAGVGGGSRLLALDVSNAVATVIGPLLAGRNIRGAMFTLAGRLITFDDEASELLEIDPNTGNIIGTPRRITALLPGESTSRGDLTLMPDGSCLFAYDSRMFRLDLQTGALTLLLTETNALADGYLISCSGLACSPLAAPDNTIFGFDVTIEDDIYSYQPAAGWLRTQHVRNIVSSYNAGRGDLASLPAARMENPRISVTGTNATLTAVCRGGCWAEVIFTDDLGAPNWQVAPGTAGWVPYTPGTVATPMTWTNLSANAPQRFFRVRVQ